MSRTTLRLVTLAAVFVSSAHFSRAANLVHRWSFENNLLDTSGSGNDGTLAGGDLLPQYTTGAFGSALDLNSAEGITKTSANNLPLGGSDPWTMNVWLNFLQPPGGLTYYAGFGNHNTFNSDPVEHGTSRGLIAFGSGYYFWGCNCVSTPNPDIDSGAGYTADGGWHMYTVVNDGSNIHMYADANLVTSAPNNLLTTPFDQVQVGNPSVWNSDARAGIDEFAIWDGALNARAVRRLFSTNSAIPEPATSFLAVVGCGLAFAGMRRRGC